MRVFAKTDVGRERTGNEDYFYTSDENDDIKLYIIADGMGGYNAGEVASKMATEAFKEYVYNNFEKNRYLRENIIDMMYKGIQYANQVVYKSAKSKLEYEGMGTTLDACLIYNSKIYIAHVGDSRVYRVRNDFIRKITKDHSYVQTLVEDGTITKEEALHHPKKNMLTKAIGCNEEIEPDIYVKTFLKDDIILMTTDGLTNMVKENDICKIISKDLTNAAQNLIDKANENGGLDNITAVIVAKD